MFKTLMTTTAVAALTLGAPMAAGAADKNWTGDPVPSSVGNAEIGPHGAREFDRIPRGSAVVLQQRDDTGEMRMKAEQTPQKMTQTAATGNTVQHAGPQQVTVYFDFNEATIRPQAQRKLNDFFSEMELGGQEDLLINGHADRAGPAGYNLALSKDRAQAVHDFIEAAPIEHGGVNPGDLEVRWFGENQPKVATPDGVRAQANRRVVIRAVDQSADM